MKKLMYLIVAGFLFVFTACGGGANTEEATVETAEEVAPAAAVNYIPLLKGKKSNNLFYYICEDGLCKQPTSDIKEAINLLQ